MRTPIILAIVVVVASGGGCKCGKKPEAKKKVDPPPIVEPRGPDVVGNVEFDPPVKQGVRRFSAPRGQEITSVSASPDGKILAAATAKSSYVWDTAFGKAKVVDLPLSTKPRQTVALSATRLAVFSDMPTGDPQTRVWFVDAATGKPIVQKQLAGTGAIGAAFASGRLAVVVAEPPGVVVFDADGNELGQGPAPAQPRRIDVASNGAWGVIVGDGGVTSVDLSGEKPAFASLSLGRELTKAIVAALVGDNVLVAGVGPSERPLAVVVPKAGGEPIARVELGLAGKVAGAAVAGDGSRVLVLVAGKGAEDKIEQTAHVIDPTTWKTVGTAKGSSVGIPTAHSLPLDGAKALVADCHGASIADLGAMTLTENIALPAPTAGPCLDGLYLVGDRVAAREGNRVVTWPRP